MNDKNGGDGGNGGNSGNTRPAGIILGKGPLGFPWQTLDPFLACMHHDDAYPAGNEEMAPPPSSLQGRNIGMDFEGKDGWRMYHGDVVPGFPQHPHRGFETVTIARQGFIDHSDSLGAAARFGAGDVQWITAGKGICHSEMFPLLEKDKPNPLELFQIWLNLPAKNKLADPHFAMLWARDVPHVASAGADVALIAGRFHDVDPVARGAKPPPKSWAADADHDVAIWTLKLEPGASVTLPPAQKTSNRCIYFFRGDKLAVDGAALTPRTVAQLVPDVPAPLHNTGADVAELLVLQGKPIREPVAQHGPFVMNSRQEIVQAFTDYERTHFGGWPWKSDGPVHPRETSHWARFADGHEETA